MREFEGKYIYLRCNNGRVYSGKVLEVNFVGYGLDSEAKYLLIIRDKFNELVGVHSSQILVIETEKEEKDGSRNKRG